MDRCVVRMYGVRGPLGFGVRRATFLIDAGGQIIDAVAADLRIGVHARFVSRAAARGSAAG